MMENLMWSRYNFLLEKYLVLTIAPTQTCNFACTYCYENWRMSGIMDDLTEEAIINNPTARSFNLKTVH